jgi:hypothetical protein
MENKPVKVILQKTFGIDFVGIYERTSTNTKKKKNRGGSR